MFFNEAERYKMHEFQNVYKMNLCYKVSHSLKLERGGGRSRETAVIWLRRGGGTCPTGWAYIKVPIYLSIQFLIDVIEGTVTCELATKHGRKEKKRTKRAKRTEQRLVYETQQQFCIAIYWLTFVYRKQ